MSTALGLDAAALGIEAHLYKMLVYERDGHFKKHKDTEKEVGMFGTLLVQLPARHYGGDLVVEHGGVTKRFSFGGPQSAQGCFYTAFYDDCDHTLEAVTSGDRCQDNPLRLVLAFNLVRTKHSMPMPRLASAEKNDDAVDVKGGKSQLERAIKVWENSIGSPQKFIYKVSIVVKARVEAGLSVVLIPSFLS